MGRTGGMGQRLKEVPRSLGGGGGHLAPCCRCLRACWSASSPSAHVSETLTPSPHPHLPSTCASELYPAWKGWTWAGALGAFGYLYAIIHHQVGAGLASPGGGMALGVM